MMDREKDLQRRCILFRNGFAQRKHADIFLLLSECRAFLDDEQNRGPLSLPFAKSLLLLLRRYQEDVAATLNNNDGDGALTAMQEKLMVTSFEEACGVLRRLLNRAGGAATSASTQQPSSKEQFFHVFLTQEHLDGWLALIGPILAGLAGSSSPAKVKVQPWTKLLRTLLATARDVAAECAKAVNEADEFASLQQEGVLEPETEIYGPALESCLKQWSRDCFNGFVAVGESPLREDVVGVADLKAWLSESSAVLATWFSNEQALRMQVASGLTVAATRLRADFGPAEAEAAWDWCLAGIQNTETIGANGRESVSTLLEFYRESFLHNLVLHASSELQRRLDESMLLLMSAPATAASIEALFPDNLVSAIVRGVYGDTSNKNSSSSATLSVADEDNKVKDHISQLRSKLVPLSTRVSLCDAVARLVPALKRDEDREELRERLFPFLEQDEQKQSSIRQELVESGVESGQGQGHRGDSCICDEPLLQIIEAFPVNDAYPMLVRSYLSAMTKISASISSPSTSASCSSSTAAFDVNSAAAASRQLLCAKTFDQQLFPFQIFNAFWHTLKHVLNTATAAAAKSNRTEEELGCNDRGCGEETDVWAKPRARLRLEEGTTGAMSGLYVDQEDVLDDSGRHQEAAATGPGTTVTDGHAEEKGEREGDLRPVSTSTRRPRRDATSAFVIVTDLHREVLSTLARATLERADDEVKSYVAKLLDYLAIEVVAVETESDDRVHDGVNQREAPRRRELDGEGAADRSASVVAERNAFAIGQMGVFADFVTNEHVGYLYEKVVLPKLRDRGHRVGRRPQEDGTNIEGLCLLCFRCRKGVRVEFQRRLAEDVGTAGDSSDLAWLARLSSHIFEPARRQPQPAALADPTGQDARSSDATSQFFFPPAASTYDSRSLGGVQAHLPPIRSTGNNYTVGGSSSSSSASQARGWPHIIVKPADIPLAPSSAFATYGYASSQEATEGYTQLQAARLWLLLQEGAQETDGASTGRIRALKAALQSLLPSPESRAKFAQSLLRDLSPATDDGLEVAEKAASSIQLDLSHALAHWRDCVLSRDFADLTREDSRAPSSSSGSANAKLASSFDVFRGRFTKPAAEQDVRVQRYNELARDAFVKDVLILSRLRENPHVDTPQGYFVEEVHLEKAGNVGDSKAADEVSPSSKPEAPEKPSSRAARSYYYHLVFPAASYRGECLLLLRHFLSLQEAVEEEAVLGLLAQVARAIAYAHASGVLLCRFTADSVCVIEASEGGAPRALLHSGALVDARPLAGHSGGETLRAELDVYAPGCLKASSSQVRASDVAMAERTSGDVLLEYVAPEAIEHGMLQGALCSMHSDWFAFGALVAKAILSPGDMDALSLSGLERHPVTKLLTFPAQVVSTNSSASRRPGWSGLDVPIAQVYALDLTQTLLAEAPAMRLSLLPGGQVLAHPGFELATARPTTSPALCPTAKRRVPEQPATCSEDDNDSADADFPSPFREVFEQLSFLREQYRYVCSKEPLLFQRKKVFQQILHSNLLEWQSDILLGEWRTLLEGESGVDGGGLRREIFHLFFQQMFQQKDFVSRHVEDEAVLKQPPGRQVQVRALAGRQELQEEDDEIDYEAFFYYIPKEGAAASSGAEDSGADERHHSRKKSTFYNRSRQDWRHSWRAVGVMSLRCLIHCHQLPCPLSALVWSAALGRLVRLPPDDAPVDGEGAEQAGGDDHHTSFKRLAARMRGVRATRGASWARAELLFCLHTLQDPDRERTYRWMLAQLGTTAGSACAHTTAGSYGRYGYRYNRPCDLEREQTLPCNLVDDVFADLLDPRAHFWLRSECRAHDDDANAALYRLPQNMLDWVILWDIYLVYVGDDQRRWDAYAALREGLTLSGRFARLFSDAPFHGSGATFLSAFFAGGQDKDEQMDGTLSTSYSGGKRLLANVEFRPEHGYEKQKTYFKEIIEQQFSAAERARFLTFAVSLSRLPRSGRFPGGQKLSVRFLGGDDQEMLPAAHTCTWTLDMPAYDTQERMLRKLRQAIEGAALPFAVS